MATKFLLGSSAETADYGVSGVYIPSPAPPATKAPYLAETADYGVEIGEIINEKLPAGRQRIYFVVHKQHNVIATEAFTLSFAIQIMEAAQHALDAALGKGGDTSKHGAN